MSTEACSSCGAQLDPLATRCPECGASTRHRKRGELSGMRIDPERIERVLVELDLESPSRSWGRPSDRPTHSEDRDAQVRARRRFDDAPAAETPARAPRSEPPPALSLETPHAREPGGATTSAATAARQPTHGAHATTEPGHQNHAPASQGLPDSEGAVRLPTAHTEPHGKLQAAATPRASAARPPVLASEALLRDLAPARPAPRALRYCAASLGAAGLALVLLLTGDRGIGVPVSAAFLTLVLLSMAPMHYAARAASVVTVASSGLVLILASTMGRASRDESLVLTLAVTLLAAGLYFRAFHRASGLARVLVILGVLVGIAFLEMSGALRHLTMNDTAWQSWVPRLLSLPFGFLLMLSLLAFMDSRTTGGCSVWASCVLLFHGLHAGLHWLRMIWPKGATEPELARVATNLALAWLCTPLFTALLALGLAQVLASTMARTAGASGAGPSQRPT